MNYKAEITLVVHPKKQYRMNNRDVIICVDDESIILTLIKAQLESHFGDRYAFLYFQNAESALQEVQTLKQQKKNVVMAIVDQILPGKQGTDLLTELKPLYPNVIKILFSGKSDFSAVITAINESEIFRYLIKPWDQVDFLNIVQRGLEQYYTKENIELQLAEIHHRVKNNLTIISCLLELQVGEMTDSLGKEYFKQSINRINSIAQVHELIYESNDMASVDIKKYLEKIIPSIQQTLPNFKANIDLNLDIPSHKLKVNQAIPLGLIFNELITNSFKHAFNDSKTARISIKMSSQNQIAFFSYEDNGSGFLDSFDFNNTQHLGLTLIHLQLQQLNSTYKVHTNGYFKLDFSFDTRNAKYLADAFKQVSPLA